MTGNEAHTAEHQRLADSEARRADWKQWGPYVSERAWGTVREDYSPGGDAWDYFPHDHARSRAYRWNEDGLGGFSNRFQNICLAVALWNEHDPILKERLFGVTGPQGNHGEDVKEYYFYLDGTPTHSYQKMLYKYPQTAYPYEQLVAENGRRGYGDPEFELIDALRTTFEQSRYFDVFIEYAKAEQEDILCRITAVNRGPDPAPIHVLPQIWFRNTWSWRTDKERPALRAVDANTIHTDAPHLAERWWTIDGAAPLLFTENETNTERLYSVPNRTLYVKDAFHETVVRGRAEAVSPAQAGSKAAAHFQAVVPPGESYTVRVRFSDRQPGQPFADFDAIFSQRIAEADAFYAAIQPAGLSDDQRLVQRQAWAGLLWSKQFYHYSVDLWLDGDPATPPPPAVRQQGRNRGWRQLYTLDVLSMPDKWEYPWFAAWDLAFHMIPLAMVDPEWAKRQMILLLREWYMHPNGQLPAYEDVATKFFEHFIYIADAINHLSGTSASLWDEEDGFYYDMLHLDDGAFVPLKVRSFVGLIPIFAVETLEPELLERLPRFRERMQWFIKYRRSLVANVCSLTETGVDDRLLLAIPSRERLQRVLQRMLDSDEFLSDYGLRSLSRHHLAHPYTFNLGGQAHSVRYVPAESDSGMFGGNSNWRGPIWFPVNYLMIESLEKYHRYYGDSLSVELPSGSGRQVTLAQAAGELAQRLTRIFLRDEAGGGHRPVFGQEPLFQDDPHWRDHVLFYEYFHGDSGAGAGASHQTGWTALVAKLLQDAEQGKKQ